MPILIATFVLLSIVVVIAGTMLAKYGDRLGESLGLARSMTGMMLLATATSLPELAVDCHAAMIPSVDLAVGDLLGSCLFNLLILAVLDLLSRTRGRMLSRAAAAHALSATACITLTSFVVLALLVDVPQWPFPRFGPGSVLILIGYLGCLRLIYFDQRFTRTIAEQQTLPARQPITRRRAVIGYVAATTAILAAAPVMAGTAHELARVSGLGGTFVGTAFVALSTSLPEVSTTREAVRMGAHDMAVGNILGSNAFNIMILVPVDLCFEGSLFASASSTHAVTAVCVIVVTAVTAMGLLYRAEKRWWVIEPDAVLVIVLIAASLVLVYLNGV